MYRLSSFVLLTAAALAGCATYTADYEARLLDALPQKRGAIIEETSTYPGKILCGRYTARSFGGFGAETKPFVVTPDAVLTRASRDAQAVYCSDDSQGQLFEVSGIGGENADWEALAKVAQDLRAIDAAVLVFYNTQQRPPEVLEELLEGDYGVDAGQLRDPWGHPYDFDPGLAGRSLPKIRLESLGADGERGGRGPDADISLERVALVEHVLRLRRR
jgi:hypothetical protein